jgi:hypothetical protein
VFTAVVSGYCNITTATPSGDFYTIVGRCRENHLIEKIIKIINSTSAARRELEWVQLQRVITPNLLP